MVAPSAMAASMSSDMPMDRVSSWKFEAIQLGQQFGHDAELSPLQGHLVRGCGDRHQAAQLQPRQGCYMGRECRRFLGRYAAFAGFAADVHLQAYLQWRQFRGSGGGEALGDFCAIDAVHPGEVFGYLARFIALQRADEMPFQGQIAQCGHFCQRFLHITFAEFRLSGLECLAHSRVRKGFAYRQELDGLCWSAIFCRRSKDAMFNGLQGARDCCHNDFVYRYIGHLDRNKGIINGNL